MTNEINHATCEYLALVLLIIKIFQITTETKDCMPIETVMQTRKSKPKYLQKLSEESDGQWMGTVVQSQGKGKCYIVKV